MNAKLTILFLLILLFLTGFIFSILIWFSKSYASYLVNKINKNNEKLEMANKEITEYVMQLNNYAENDEQYLQLKKEILKKQVEFDELFNSCLFKSNNINNKLKIHKNRHLFLEIKCVNWAMKSYRKVSSVYKDAMLIFNYIKLNVNEKVLYPSKIIAFVSYLKNKDKKANSWINSFRLINNFFNEQFHILNSRIANLYLYFEKDEFIKYSRKVNVNKLNELNDLICKKILIYSHGNIYFEYIDSKIPNAILKLQEKQNTANFSIDFTMNANIKKMYDNRFIKLNTYLKNELALLDFSQESLFKDKLIDFIVELKKINQKIKVEQSAKIFINDVNKSLFLYKKNILDKLKANENFFEKYEGKVDPADFQFNTLKKMNFEINAFIKEDIQNLEFLLEKNEKNSYLKIITNLKMLLQKINEYQLLQDKLDKNILFYRNEKTNLKKRYEQLQNLFIYLLSISNQLKIEISEKDLLIINKINNLQSIIAEEFKKANNNLIIRTNVENYEKLIDEFFENKAIQIEAAKLLKIVIQKISPLCSSQEVMMDLYLKLIDYNSASQYLKAIEHLDEFIKNKIN